MRIYYRYVEGNIRGHRIQIFASQQVLVLYPIYKHKKKRILADLTPHLDLTHFVYAEKYSAES